MQTPITQLRDSHLNPHNVGLHYSIKEIIDQTESYDLGYGLSAHYVQTDGEVRLLAMIHEGDRTPCVNVTSCYDADDLERVVELINESLAAEYQAEKHREHTRDYEAERQSVQQFER